VGPETGRALEMRIVPKDWEAHPAMQSLLDHDRVSAVEQRVVHLFALVAEGLAAATAAFLEGDRDGAGAIVAPDPVLDDLYLEAEALVHEQLAADAFISGEELLELIAVFRILPELERSGDLVEHIALRASQNLGGMLSPRCRGLIQRMSEIAVELWRAAAAAYQDGDPGAAHRLRQRDDDLDALHVELTAELAASDPSVAVAIEMGLVGRFYERLGDHAVNLARRVHAPSRRLTPVPTGGRP
jgi:phosphate transport system protein